MSALAMRWNLSRTATSTTIAIGGCRRSFHRATPHGDRIAIINCPSPLLQHQNLRLEYRYRQPFLQSGLPQRASFSSSPSHSHDADDKARLTTLRLYRILQRQCMALSQNNNNNSDDDVEAVLMQPQLRAPDWGRHSKFMIPTTTSLSDLYGLFYSIFEDDDDDDKEDTGNRNIVNPFYSSSSLSFRGSIHHWYNDICVVHPPPEPTGIPLVATCWTNVPQLRHAIREAFRTKYSTTMDPRHLRKWAIHANQLLQQQEELWKHSSVATSENIRIVATSRYVFVLVCFVFVRRKASAVFLGVKITLGEGTVVLCRLFAPVTRLLKTRLRNR
jgi:hypothetical protein